MTAFLRARAVIEEAGGLINLRGIQRRYEVPSTSTVHKITKHPDFPAPLPTDGHERLWLVAEIHPFFHRRVA